MNASQLFTGSLILQVLDKACRFLNETRELTKL
jgi:hypothetical protein